MSKRSDVGYKRPPAEHRFKAGQSGNPKGRPKGQTQKIGDHPLDNTLHKAWMEEANKQVTVVINGRRERRSMGRLAIERVFADAAAGKPTAQRIVHAKMTESDRTLRDRWIESLDVDGNLWRKAKAELEEKKAAGEINPVVIPHPDDFVFNRETGRAEIVGPMDEEQHKIAMYWAKRVNAIVSVLDGEMFKEARNPHRLTFIQRLSEWNQLLPPRLRRWPRSRFPEDGEEIFPEECVLHWVLNADQAVD